MSRYGNNRPLDELIALARKTRAKFEKAEKKYEETLLAYVDVGKDLAELKRSVPKGWQEFHGEFIQKPSKKWCDTLITLAGYEDVILEHMPALREKKMGVKAVINWCKQKPSVGTGSNTREDEDTETLKVYLERLGAEDKPDLEALPGYLRLVFFHWRQYRRWPNAITNDYQRRMLGNALRVLQEDLDAKTAVDRIRPKSKNVVPFKRRV